MSNSQQAMQPSPHRTIPQIKVVRMSQIQNAGKPVHIIGKPVQIAGKPVQVTGKPVHIAGKPVQVVRRPVQVTGQSQMPVVVAHKPAVFTATHRLPVVAASQNAVTTHMLPEGSSRSQLVNSSVASAASVAATSPAAIATSGYKQQHKLQKLTEALQHQINNDPVSNQLTYGSSCSDEDSYNDTDGVGSDSYSSHLSCPTIGATQQVVTTVPTVGETATVTTTEYNTHNQHDATNNTSPDNNMTYNTSSQHTNMTAESNATNDITQQHIGGVVNVLPMSSDSEESYTVGDGDVLGDNMIGEQVEVVTKEGALLKQCELCDQFYKDQQCLDQHMQRDHAHTAAAYTNLTRPNAQRHHQQQQHSPPSPHQQQHANHHTCVTCLKVFKTRMQLHNHERAEHQSYGQTSPPTDGGETSPNDGQTAKQLIRTEDRRGVGQLMTPEGRYVCDVCHKSYRSRSILRTHKITHGKQKPFRCTECGQGFNSISNLNNHKYKHTGQRFPCPECGKSYSSPGNMKTHINKVHMHLQEDDT